MRPEPARETTATDVAFVPASFELLPMLTVAENVALPVRLVGAEPDAGWIAAVLRAVDLDGAGDRRPAELSRGEQLRVALARALATGPETLVVDDPAGTVDSVTRQGALRTLREIADELQMTVILATGDVV